MLCPLHNLLNNFKIKPLENLWYITSCYVHKRRHVYYIYYPRKVTAVDLSFDCRIRLAWVAIAITEIPNYFSTRVFFYFLFASLTVGNIFITCACGTLKQMAAILFASSVIFQGPPIVAKAGPEETPRRIALTANEDLPPRKSPVTVQEWVDSLPHPGEVPSSPVIQWVERAPHYIFVPSCRPATYTPFFLTLIFASASQIWVRGCLRCDLGVSPQRAISLRV